MDDYHERQQEIVERTLSAKLALWAAMLTVHSVFLSVAVGLLATDAIGDKLPFKWVGSLAIVSMILILLNFVMTKAQYEIIGHRLLESEQSLTEAQRVRDLRAAISRKRVATVVEWGSVLGTVAQVGILGWVLLWL
jgi:uncharacterized membrane protein YcjF (UPF0283 family)